MILPSVFDAVVFEANHDQATTPSALSDAIEVPVVKPLESKLVKYVEPLVSSTSAELLDNPKDEPLTASNK